MLNRNRVRLLVIEWEPLLIGLAMALGALALAWMATSARCLALINWDNSAYVGAYGVGKLTWSTLGWDAHFAIGNIYLLGVWLARWFGGTTIDGFRLTDAVFFAAAAMLIAMACYALVRERLLAVLLTLAWMTAWVNMHLLFTLEDNILYLVTGAGVMWLSAKHLGHWRRAHSLAAGALAGMAMLCSWQAVLYLGPPSYAALIGGPRQRAARWRAADMAWVVAAFLAMLVGWCLFLAATSNLSAQTLLQTLFRRPDTLGTPDFSLMAITRRLGIAMAFSLMHTALWVPTLPFSMSVGALGTGTLVLLTGLFIAATWWSFRRHDYQPHFLAASILLFAVVTPMRPDVDYAYLKRFDFLPIMLVLLVAKVLSQLPSQTVRRAAALALALVTAGQVALAVRWDRQYLALYPKLPTYATLPHPERAWYGREGQSFYAYYRGLRIKNKAACRHVFALTEVWEGGWNFDNPASLWSELPEHIVLGDPEIVSKWRYRPRMVTPAQFRSQQLEQSCDWFSDDARQLLARTSP